MPEGFTPLAEGSIRTEYSWSRQYVIHHTNVRQYQKGYDVPKRGRCVADMNEVPQGQLLNRAGSANITSLGPDFNFYIDLVGRMHIEFQRGLYDRVQF